MLSCVRSRADEDAIVNVLCRSALTGVASMLLAACSAVGYRISDLAAEINATRDVVAAVVAPGDTIKVTFPKLTGWNHEARVRPDGTATFHGLDDVQVAGLTLPELDKKLTQLYAEKKLEQNSDELTVDIATTTATISTTAGVTPDTLFVVGEVQHPGPVTVAGRSLTLFEAIASAGGHQKATANLSNVILVRRLHTGEMRSWRLDADIYRWGNEPPIWLQPRDIVFVPNTAIDEVNIWVDKYIRQMIPLPTLVPPP
jgi:protein involved in polysaccharide export with SLBB domain